MLQDLGQLYKKSWKALIILMGFALLSGCVIVPRGAYYVHPCWRCRWWR